MTLHTIAEEIRRCTSCPLWKKRTLPVAGDGPANSKIMFIGEAPGMQEDRVGHAFVGKSGKFLDEMLLLTGLNRKEVFVTGAVKCHPPKNRNPKAIELGTCKDLWLVKQIELINPKLIVCLGKVGAKAVLGTNEKISEIHGKVMKIEGKKVFITYHPAAGMRFPSIKAAMKQDFKKLGKIKL